MIDLTKVKNGDRVEIRNVSMLRGVDRGGKDNKLEVTKIIRVGAHFELEFAGITGLPGWVYYRLDGKCPVCTGVDIISVEST